MVSTNFLFPELYTNGERPPKCGVIDKERYSLPTPAYGFGWVISRLELFKALNTTNETPMRIWLRQLPYTVRKRFVRQWEANGYEGNIYNPTIPEAKDVGEDFVLILLACNSYVEVMDSIMANKAYHDKCRACMNNPKTMELEPTWFRVGLRRMPKGFIPDDEDAVQNE